VLSGRGREDSSREETAMGLSSLFDKITGRAKKTVADVTDDPSLRQEGAREEAKGERKDELERAHERADQKAAEVADLERKT
jgi:uncharacterized protein YjbJ (UPF0337 family)